MRQAALLKMKEQAQAQIAEAETKVSHEVRLRLQRLINLIIN